MERLLLHRPSWDAVRLFYGVVLYRLGDLEGAKRELNVLEGRALTAEQESDRQRYLSLASKKSSPLRISSRISIGARVDSNPGRVADNAAGNPLNFGEETDGAGTVTSRLRAELDLNNGRGDYLFFQNNSNLRDYFDVDRADLLFNSSRLGAQFHAKGFVARAYGLFGTSFLQYEKFRSRYGGGGSFSFTVTPQVAAFVRGQAAYEDYETTSFSTLGNQRDGWKWGTTVGARFRASDTLTITGSLGFQRKDAQNDGFSYERGRVSVKAFKLLGEGRYLAASGSYSRSEYDAIDNFYSTTVARETDAYYGRIAAGAPLSVLASRFDVALPRAIANIVAQVGVTYTHQESNIDRLDIRNLSGDLIFTKRFSF